MTILVFTSLVSALDISQNSIKLSQEGGSFTLDIVNATPSSSVDLSINDLNDSDGDKINFVFSASITTDSNGTGSIVINYTTTDFDFDLGKSYSTTLTAVDSSDSSSDIATLSFGETNFYKGENKGELKISDIEFNVAEGFGDDEDYWYPLDEIEVTFNVENKGDWDVKDIKIEACLWDNDKEKCVLDEDDMDIDKDDFDLDSDGDDEDVKLTFNVDPDKLKAGNTDYTLYIRAVGEVDDNDSPYDGDETGDSSYKSIDILTDEKFVILNNIELSKQSASCEDTVTLTAEVWNVGDEDLDDDEVYVRLYNKALGINKVIEFSSGIDKLDYEELSFTFEVPSDIDEKIHSIEIVVYEDDSLGDKYIFENNDNDKAKFTTSLKIEGCSTAPKATISASLGSEAKEGEELIVKATIINTGSSTQTFSLSASDYADWASLESISQNSITLTAGSAQEVTIKLNVKEDVSGDKKFNIELNSGNKYLSQQVSVNVEEVSSSSFMTGFLSGLGKDNMYLWGIGALNLILVLIIIFVAVRIVKKKE